METLQFEAVKVALKQDKTGYVLTLCLHPDEIPEALMRDFVGARYQVVMVRLNGEDKPMNKDIEYQRDPVRTAGILCRSKPFAEYLMAKGEIIDDDEMEVIAWLRSTLGIESRSELKTNPTAAAKFWRINEDFQLWTQSV